MGRNAWKTSVATPIVGLGFVSYSKRESLIDFVFDDITLWPKEMEEPKHCSREELWKGMKQGRS
jgi:hypothetical protein